MKVDHRSLVACCLLATMAGPSARLAHASPMAFDDLYVGGNAHGYGDVIASANQKDWFDIEGAEVSWIGTQLQIDIFTDFATSGLGKFPGSTYKLVTDPNRAQGLAQIGEAQWLATNNGQPRPGIGAGDLFLSIDGWHPFGGGLYTSDTLSNGTTWNYALALDDRWSPTGSGASLIALPDRSSTGSDYLDAIMTSGDFLSSGTYRNGQAVAVDRTATGVSEVLNSGGSWTPMSENGSSFIRFLIDTTDTGLASADSVGIHWGETCANDVIELGFVLPQTDVSTSRAAVPEPATFALLLPGLMWLRLRKTA